MALNKYKNDISQEEFRGQRLTVRDLEQFGRGKEFAEIIANDPHFIFVTKIYDGANTLIDIKSKRVLPDVDPRTNEFVVDPAQEVRSLGYRTGTFRVEYLFWRYLVGEQGLPGVYVQEISPSRTEVKIIPSETGDDATDIQLTQDFVRFSNLVLDADEANVLLDDLFFEITREGISDVMINTINEGFMVRLYRISKFDTNEDTKNALKTIIEDSIQSSRPKMLEELTQRGFVSFVKFVEIFDTVLRQEIFNRVTQMENYFDFITLEEENS